MSDQLWLSMDAICTSLGMTESHVKRLAEAGVLGVIYGTSKARKYLDARFLDPTPEYRAKLRMGEALYGRLHPIPVDVLTTPLLTMREIAEILGVDVKAVRRMVEKKRLQVHGGVKAGQYTLYPVNAVRDALWRRTRKLSGQKAPFLVEDLVRFFLSYLDKENAVVPSDLDFKSDDLLHAKFTRLLKLPSPQKEQALRDLWEKVETAQAVAAAHSGQAPPAPEATSAPFESQL